MCLKRPCLTRSSTFAIVVRLFTELVDKPNRQGVRLLPPGFPSVLTKENF
jgi:hypothetical protein